MRLRVSSVGVLVVKVFGTDSGAEVAFACSPTVPAIWQLHKPQLDQHYEVGNMSENMSGSVLECWCGHSCNLSLNLCLCKQNKFSEFTDEGLPVNMPLCGLVVATSNCCDIVASGKRH